MEKFKGKYHTGSIRLEGYDYSNNGAYFITICTQNKEKQFGTVTDEVMHENALGKLVREIWFTIPSQFPFISLGAFIVMPNHIHGILLMHQEATQEPIAEEPTQTKELPGGVTGNQNPMLHKSISRAIRWYKGRCTFEIHKSKPSFMWQARFHDHIIRNDESFVRIDDYIRTNPSKWLNDRFFQ
jgi:putative transposase